MKTQVFWLLLPGVLPIIRRITQISTNFPASKDRLWVYYQKVRKITMSLLILQLFWHTMYKAE